MKEKCLKLTHILLAIFNIIFLIVGGSLCSLVIYIQVVQPPFGKDIPAIAGYICIGLHACLGITGLLGVCSVAWPKKVQEKIGDTFDGWQRSYQYNGKADSTELMDIIHKRLYCCGGQSYRDYRSSSVGDTPQIPWSCCNAEKLGPAECQLKPYSLPFELAYDRGCRSVVVETAWRFIRIGLFASVGLTALELLSIIMSLCVCCLCGGSGADGRRSNRRSRYSALPLPDGFPAGGHETRL